MYSTNAPISVGLTENAAYPRCQAKPFTPWLLIHCDETVFKCFTKSATFVVRDKRTAI